MNSFLRKSRIFAIVFVIANLFFAGAAFGQTVSTNLLDYPPGATAIITGTGFEAGETVTLLVEHVGEEPSGTDPQYHMPWTVVADSIGSFVSSWYVPTDGDALGATFLLTADGAVAHAEWEFTDGNPPVPYNMSTANYFEDFSGISTWSANFNTGPGSGPWGSVIVNATGVIPDGVKTTVSTATYTTGTSGGVQKGTNNIQLLSTGTADNTSSCAIDLYLNFTGRNAGTLSFNWSSVNNTTGDRKASLKIYTSINGTSWTELPAAAVLNFTNNALTSGSVTNITLPTTFNGAASARIRFYEYNGTGGTIGSRPKIALDDVMVTSTATTNNGGIYQSYAIMNFGGSDVFYDLNATTGNADFSGSLGTYNSSQSLYLDGAENKTYKCSSVNITNSKLFYRIYPTSTPSGTFQQVNLPFASNDVGAGGGCQNQTWRENAPSSTLLSGVNILNNLCDGNYTIEVFTTADFTEGSNSGTLFANNNGANYKATFSIDNTTKSGINQSFIVLNPKGLGNTFYDLQPTSGNPDFQESNLGTFCTNETLVIAGAENKVFKCSPNDITGNSLRYRVYTGTPGSLAYQTVPISTVISTVGTGFTCFDQTWQNLSNTTNIIPTTPGTYTLEVYSEAAYTSFNGVGLCSGTHFANNGGTNYKATFTVLAPVTFTTTPAATVSANTGTGLCTAIVNYNFVTAGSTPITTTYNFSGATTASGPGTGSGSTFNKGTTLVTVTASNACSPNAVYSFDVVVTDATSPTVITQNATVNLDATGSVSVTAAQIDNGSSDACGIASVTVSPSSFICSNLLPVMSDLIISEYVEGSSNNKAIEIYNGTNAAISLSGYEIRVYSNGNTSPTTITLTGSVAAGGVFVIANPSANATILAKASQTSAVISYNGDDAVTLTKSGNHLDIIGRIGNDPGVEWTDGGSYSTLDATLRRKLTVTAGISVSPTGTGPGAFTTLTSEWNVSTTDDVSGLGTHGNSVTLTVTDNNGNIATGTAAVIVKDLIAPVITTNGNQNVNNDSNVCGASVTVSASATDNCTVGTPTGVRSDALALNAVYPVGTTTITWNVSDANGNAATAVTQTVVVTDNQIPVIATNGDKNINTDLDVCGASVTVSATATDNCTVGTPTGVRSDALALNAVYPVGTTTITWNVSDANGNAATAVTQTVVVTDNQIPVIATNGDKNINTDLNVCGASVTVSASATDNCTVGTPTGVRSDALALNAVYPVGTTTITWNVSDANGNAATAVTQTVVVTDNQIPVIATNGDKNINTDVNVCGASVTVSASATDNCTVGTPTGVRSDALALNAVYPVGTTTITWNVSDANGNAATAVTQTVVVTDNQIPVIATNGDKNINTDVNVCGASVTVSASATDNCTVGTPTGVRSDALALNAVYPVGTTTITWNVSDANGNAATAVTQTVVVTDNQIPVIASNGDKNVNTDLDVCGASVTVSASATDNCTVGTPTGVRSDALALNAVYPVGTTTITWNVSDANGNAATAVTQTVVVTDNQIPVIASNGDKNVNTDLDVCGASVTVSASATDNCTVGTPTGVRSDALALTAVYPVGTTTITWNVSDANGNAATAVTQTVVVTDNQIPVIATNGDKNVNTDLDVCGASVTVSASATDNCTVGTPTGVRSDALALTAVYPVGTTTITWNVSDANGNAATAVTQTVVVTDNQIPVIASNGDKNVNTDLDVCGASVTVSATATDNCTVGTPTGVRSDALALTAVYPVGTTTITWNVSDANGNAATAVTQTVVVTDNQIPVIASNGDKNVNTDLDVCGASVTVSATATDNCTVGTPTGVRSDALALNAVYPVGTTTITWNVSDANGNAATAVTQTVVVTDNQIPVIASNGDKNINTDLNVCGASVTVSASATDNCTVGTPTGVRSDALALNAVYPVGTTTITWNVSDANGNAATAVTQTVVVTDNQIPVIATNGDKNINTDVNVCGASVTVSASATDNCTVGTPTGVRSDALALNAVYPVGTTTITWNVSDANGNAATAVTQTVVVTDNQIPVIATNGDKNINTDVNVCGASVTVSATATDNCTVGTPTGVRSDALALNAVYPVGTTTITWNVSDANGNAATAVTQTVVVTDNQIPVITCTTNKTVIANNTSCTFKQAFSGWDSAATDNCSVSSIKYTLSGATTSATDAFTTLNNVVFNLGLTTVTAYAYDASNNKSLACMFDVTVSNNNLSATFSTNNNWLYFGYPGDQTATIRAIPSGGTGNYTVQIKMSRSLKYNVINSTGDELWTASGGATTTGVGQPLSCPTTLVGCEGSGYPTSTWTNVSPGTIISVNVSLLKDAIFTVKVTDANGCDYESSSLTGGATNGGIDAEDVRCFAGNSNVQKVTICHRTGSANNPCVTICVNENAVAEHLAHGDYMGRCLANCDTPVSNARQIDLAFKVIAYPNPTQDHFTLSIENGSDENVSFEVFDILGRLVRQYDKRFKDIISFGDDLPSGAYLVIVKQGTNQSTLKLIKS